MRTLDLNILIREFVFEEMTDADRQLLEQAKQATDNAYAKYSNFYVGAAALLDDGSVVIGSNQEMQHFHQACVPNVRPSLLPNHIIPQSR